MFILDMGLFSRKSHEIPFKEALTWTIIWVSLAITFNIFVYFELGRTKALEFLAGYLIEQSLSVDNLFVFIMIFSYFNIKKEYQPKILKWGIIGALIMRALFITTGIGVLEYFSWMTYIFGAILIFTGLKMALGKNNALDPEKNRLVKFIRKFIPINEESESGSFFVKRNGVFSATPLFLTLIVIESSDIIFAIDSIPAVLAITRDPFIVYTSNIFAIMGLRSLYYLLSNLVGMFAYLKIGVSFILIFVGLKMLLSLTPYKLPIQWSLGIIFGILFVSITASLIKPQKTQK